MTRQRGPIVTPVYYLEPEYSGPNALAGLPDYCLKEADNCWSDGVLCSEIFAKVFGCRPSRLLKRIQFMIWRGKPKSSDGVIPVFLRRGFDNMVTWAVDPKEKDDPWGDFFPYPSDFLVNNVFTDNRDFRTIWVKLLVGRNLTKPNYKQISK